MIKSAVTIALVPQIKTGPWIFWNDLEMGMKQASELGFDAVELFTASAESIDPIELEKLLAKYRLGLAAVGTGAGKVLQGLTLTDPDPAIRGKALTFILDMIAFGANFGAPAIIGSMQGNVLPGADRQQTIGWFTESLEILAGKAVNLGVPLIYEPLNRYETNLFNSLESSTKMLESLKTGSVRLLADLFHMNIEEDKLPQTILDFGKYIGHVHFADSNRKPMGYGHTAMAPIAEALKEVGYGGYISAEAFPFPDSETAARKTIQQFRKHFG
jgi:sugar phosphate isomerase/epimerase